MESVEELKDALCEVRKAHRIVYSYQQRMMDLMLFINSKLKLDAQVTAKKWFSNRIKREDFHMYPGMLAWDFIYSYVVEYYMGENVTEDGFNYALSIIQYSDTGFFDNTENSRTVLDTFDTEEESVSKLLFYLEVKPKTKRNWLWHMSEIVYDKSLAGRNHKASIRKTDSISQVFYSMPIERFLDEKTTIEALNEFRAYCKNNVGIEIGME